jgi:hypothetical protein
MSSTVRVGSRLGGETNLTPIISGLFHFECQENDLTR